MSIAYHTTLYRLSLLSSLCIISSIYGPFPFMFKTRSFGEMWWQPVNLLTRALIRFKLRLQRSRPYTLFSASRSLSPRLSPEPGSRPRRPSRTSLLTAPAMNAIICSRYILFFVLASLFATQVATAQSWPFFSSSSWSSFLVCHCSVGCRSFHDRRNARYVAARSIS